MGFPRLLFLLLLLLLYFEGEEGLRDPSGEDADDEGGDHHEGAADLDLGEDEVHLDAFGVEGDENDEEEGEDEGDAEFDAGGDGNFHGAVVVGLGCSCGTIASNGWIR